jgi:hypothetical protein
MDAIRVANKVLRVMASDEVARTAGSEQAIEDTVTSIDWSQVEDAVNDQLPEGYYCKLDDA